MFRQMIKAVLTNIGVVAWIKANDIETEGRFVFLDEVIAKQENIGFNPIGQPDDLG